MLTVNVQLLQIALYSKWVQNYTHPTHDEFYKKLFEFEENYTEVEEKGFIFTSEELEKLEAQVKEVKKAKNTFENAMRLSVNVNKFL